MDIKDLLKDSYREDMSAEDIITALKDIEMPTDLSGEVDRLKNALSKSNSEAADYKRQLKDRMSEDEVKAKEDAEKWAQVEKERDDLLREKNVSINKARLLGLGYDEKLAEETAEAMVNGELDKVFANQKIHLESVEKKVRADVLKETPKPTGGSGKGMSMDDIMKIKDPVERQTAIASNIELFEKE